MLESRKTERRSVNSRSNKRMKIERPVVCNVIDSPTASSSSYKLYQVVSM